MKICITGATGFVGGALVSHFLKRGDEVIACGRKENSFLGSGVSRVTYLLRDLHDPCPQSDLITYCDVLIHAAANTDYTKKKEILIADNVETLDNLLSCVSHTTHLIYISSSSIYQGLSGEIGVQTTIDSSKLTNSYALSKYLAEEKIQKRAAKNDHSRLTITRPRAVYGPGDTTLLPKILEASVMRYLLLLGPGSAKTSLTNIETLCHEIETYIEQNVYGVYHVSSEVTSYQQIYEDVCESHGYRGIIHLPYRVAKLGRYIQRNKYTYLLDTFGSDKILL